MDRNSIFERFCQVSPFATICQLLMHACIRETFGPVFEEFRGRQYEDRLTFEDLSVAVADVALGVVKNPNQAYRKHKEDLAVARGRFYDKLNGVSLSLSEQVVGATAKRLIQMQDALGFEKWQGIEGRRLVAVDGNHLQKTEKRLSPLQGSSTAPLPGTVVARLDLDRQILDRVYLLADAHQQESETCDAVASDLQADDVLVGDRHFCIVRFMEQIDTRSAGFIIRHHGRLRGVLLGSRKELGRIETGVVYEQSMRLTRQEDSLAVRRLTVELDQTTQDGDTVIHLLTNLPASVSGCQIAKVYRRRWDEENAFYYLRMCFQGELPSLGHPRAALFLFSLSVIAYNLLQVILAAFFAVYDDEKVMMLSNLYISQEIASNTPGMLVVFDEADWVAMLPKSLARQATLLKRIARQTNLNNYQKSKRAKKKKKPKKKQPNVPHRHASTAKIIGLV